MKLDVWEGFDVGMIKYKRALPVITLVLSHTQTNGKLSVCIGHE